MVDFLIHKQTPDFPEISKPKLIFTIDTLWFRVIVRATVCSSKHVVRVHFDAKSPLSIFYYAL